MKTTRTKLRETFGKLQARGVARTVGAGKVTRRRWHREKSRRLAAWEARPRPPLLRGTLNQFGGGWLMVLIIIACWAEMKTWNLLVVRYGWTPRQGGRQRPPALSSLGRLDPA
jgi:hypothetical protein